MIDDSLPTVWRSDAAVPKDALAATMTAVLDEDRVIREKERRLRVGSVLALALLCPALLWCAAYGKTPLVRGGYALMAAGVAVATFAEWMYLAWSRQATPGPADARSQLRQAAFSLSHQASLMRLAPLVSAPVFIGTALIGTWLYQERSHAEGYLLWALVGIAWVISAVVGRAKGRTLAQRGILMQGLLSDLSEPVARP